LKIFFGNAIWNVKEKLPFLLFPQQKGCFFRLSPINNRSWKSNIRAEDAEVCSLSITTYFYNFQAVRQAITNRVSVRGFFVPYIIAQTVYQWGFQLNGDESNL